MFLCPFDEKETNDASSSCFSIVSLSLHPTPFLFSTLLHTHISGCLVTFLLLAGSPVRHYQPPVLGQEPAGTHGGSCQFLFALHVCIAFCLADPDLRIIANTMQATLDLNKCFLNEFITHWEKRTLSWEDFLFRYLWIQIYIFFFFCRYLVDAWLSRVGFWLF